MARITGFSVKLDRKIYTLDVSWDEEAFTGGEIDFEAEVSIIDEVSGKVEHSRQASVHLKRITDDQPPNIFLNVGGKEFDLGNLGEIIGEDTVIDRIPRELFGMGDPFFGCLLRAGISACLSQVLECKDRTAGLEWLRPRMRAIGACLNQSGKRIVGRAALRAGYCILSN